MIEVLLHLVSCPLPARAFLRQSDVPQLAEFLSDHRVDQLPIHTLLFHPLWFVKKYSCGGYYGFITRASLRGRFRAENNADARAAGYPIQRWPYVPLTGAIVTALPHRVFEVYVAAYRFTSVAAATAYTSSVRQDFRKYALPSGALPAGFTAGTELLGDNRRTSERQIAVIGQVANVTITVWLQGGELVSWRDAAPYWDITWTRLKRLRA
ncbi:MAG TPA: hypothetical protein VFI65_32355 [Streptosporangiaceae bacterium]|nr:hypothetical protein [Streptosporangiaceae bacterium]